MDGKRTDDDVKILRWLHPYLNEKWLDEIDQKLINRIKAEKAATGVANGTVNRMLAVLRAVLRKAAMEWEMIDKAPNIKLMKLSATRIRWLSKDEALRLLQELPEHLADMAEFSLATGLRAANVKELSWSQIDLARRVAWIHPDQAKAKKAIPVPLNETAVQVLRRRFGIHDEWVFTFKGKPIVQHNTKAWTKALKRAGITEFRWHDLRHTWASWHVQNGTSLAELQQLGGWASYAMVLRYAHLAPEMLANAANNIGTILTQPKESQLLKVA